LIKKLLLYGLHNLDPLPNDSKKLKGLIGAGKRTPAKYADLD
jgi:hypothetical protein